MMNDVASNGGLPLLQQQMILAESSGEDPEVKVPKKRAETWVQEETRCLISLRKEMNKLFNTFKSNKRLWEQISAKMRNKGFDWSPTMCTDKWWNLLKEFKKAKNQCRNGGTVKLPFYKELDELLKGRSKNAVFNNPMSSKDDTYLQFCEKGMSIKICAYEDTDRMTVRTEDKILYSKKDFREFLLRHNWTGLRELKQIS